MSAPEDNGQPPPRIAVIGDVGGQLEELRSELVRLGADPDTMRLPADLTVVQVGDLIHRGPDSDGVVALVDGYLNDQPGQWVQLVGNHEAQYLQEPAFDWPERIGEPAIAMLRSWWSSGRMRAAVAVTRADEQFLIAHGGLTEGFWRRALDSPSAAGRAAQAINSFIGTHDQVLFHSGQMLGGGAANLSAGPVWAAAATELIPSWLESGQDMPFSQVHGHSAVMNWRRRQMHCSHEVAAVMTIDMDRAHETATLPGGRIIGIDPGHSRRPRRPWGALVLPSARLTK